MRGQLSLREAGAVLGQISDSFFATSTVKRRHTSGMRGDIGTSLLLRLSAASVSKPTSSSRKAASRRRVRQIGYQGSTPSGTTGRAIHMREAAAQPREVAITRTQAIPWRRLGQALHALRMQHDQVCGAAARWCLRFQRQDLVRLRTPRPRQDSEPIRSSGFYFAARWV